MLSTLQIEVSGPYRVPPEIDTDEEEDSRTLAPAPSPPYFYRIVYVFAKMYLNHTTSLKISQQEYLDG